MAEFNDLKSNFFLDEQNLNAIKPEKFDEFGFNKINFDEHQDSIKFKFTSISDVKEFDDLNQKSEHMLSGLSRKILAWPSDPWDNGPRRSAFQPYKPATVLTNLQRGNIQAKTPQVDVTQFTWHMKAGRGDLRMEDIVNVDPNEKDVNDMTGLMWSSAYGQTTTVQRLLDRGSNPKIQGKGNRTALHMAAYGGHHEIIRLLLAYGAEVNAIDEEGNTPIVYAVIEDHPYAVYELLINDADICIRNNANIVPYRLAIERNSRQAKFVIENHIIQVLSTGINL